MFTHPSRRIEHSIIGPLVMVRPTAWFPAPAPEDEEKAIESGRIMAVFCSHTLDEFKSELLKVGSYSPAIGEYYTAMWNVSNSKTCVKVE